MVIRAWPNLLGFKIVAEIQCRLAQASRDLDSIAQQRAASLAFADVYNNVYNLVTWEKGAELLQLITDTFRRLSVARRPLVYRMAVSIIKDCALYLDNVCLKNRGKPSLTDVAEELYARPVARRWRRAFAHAKWLVRVRAWRLAFDAVYLKPGNAGALRAEAHFRECAERAAGKASVKRVKLVDT